MKQPSAIKKTDRTFPAQQISVSIDRSPQEVYQFASDPRNLPRWAAGLSRSIKNIDGELIAESPLGKIKIKFVEKNTFGVLDHLVTLPSGERVYNPLRLVPNHEGSEAIFTLYRRPEMSEKMFIEDAQAVRKDLEKLKSLLEKK